MGLFDKIKEASGKLMKDTEGFRKAMVRINSAGFCGTVNRGIKNGDFWEGSYLSIEDGHGVIYGSSQEDYVFGDGDVVSIDVMPNSNCTVAKGNVRVPAISCIVKFSDGKRAQMEIMNDAFTKLKMIVKV